MLAIFSATYPAAPSLLRVRLSPPKRSDAPIYLFCPVNKLLFIVDGSFFLNFLYENFTGRFHPVTALFGGSTFFPPSPLLRDLPPLVQTIFSRDIAPGASWFFLPFRLLFTPPSPPSGLFHMVPCRFTLPLQPGGRFHFLLSPLSSLSVPGPPFLITLFAKGSFPLFAVAGNSRIFMAFPFRSFSLFGFFHAVPPFSLTSGGS